MTIPRTPLLATDCVLFDSDGRVLLIRRRNPPFEGLLALPGGFVEIGETVEQACKRELFEETGVKIGCPKLVGVYSDPGRDPRGHVCSVAFANQIDTGEAVAGDDAASLERVRDWRNADLAFDHRRIIADAELLMASK